MFEHKKFHCSMLKRQSFVSFPAINKKQCSRQLQCENPLQRCSGVNVINSSLFINSSWSSLSSTSHAVFCRGGGLGGSGQGWGGLGGVWGGGQGTFWSSCHILHYHMVLLPFVVCVLKTTKYSDSKL